MNTSKNNSVSVALSTPVTYPYVETVRGARDLTSEERRVLKSLMSRKFYDLNHPEENRRYPILARSFVPVDHDGNPSVVLLCQYHAPSKDGKFDFVVYSDGLYGKGHYASDKHGSGNMKAAMAAFEEQLVCSVLGVWPWVIDEVRKNAHKLARVS